jgi:hypothetical protein
MDIQHVTFPEWRISPLSYCYVMTQDRTEKRTISLEHSAFSESALDELIIVWD